MKYLDKNCKHEHVTSVLTFGLVCAGYLSQTRCIDCGRVFNVEKANER